MLKQEATFLKRVGKEVRRRRKLLGWSQEKLAQKADIAFNHLSRIERGITNPRLATLHRIAMALKASLAEILKFTHSQKDKSSPTLMFEELLEILKERPGLQAEFLARLLEEFRKSIRPN